MKSKKPLPRLVHLARKQGFAVLNTTNGGGWIRLAHACGLPATTKGEARIQLMKLFVMPTEPKVPERQAPNLPAKERMSRNDYAASDAFLRSFEWKQLRYKVLATYGAVCMCCGAQPPAVMHVDHIKPRRKYPDLALDFNNLQVLCATCNHGKGNSDPIDFRLRPLPEVQGDAASHMREITGSAS